MDYQNTWGNLNALGRVTSVAVSDGPVQFPLKLMKYLQYRRIFIVRICSSRRIAPHTRMHVSARLMVRIERS